MKLKIEILQNNAAFDDGHRDAETARILRALAHHIEYKGSFKIGDRGKLRDSNGNVTGSVTGMAYERLVHNPFPGLPIITVDKRMKIRTQAETDAEAARLRDEWRKAHPRIAEAWRDMTYETAIKRSTRLRGERRMKISLVLAWYDFWIGIFWDRNKRKLYVLPLPCVGLAFEFPRRNESNRPAHERRS